MPECKVGNVYRARGGNVLMTIEHLEDQEPMEFNVIWLYTSNEYTHPYQNSLIVTEPMDTWTYLGNIGDTLFNLGEELSKL